MKKLYTFLVCAILVTTYSVLQSRGAVRGSRIIHFVALKYKSSTSDAEKIALRSNFRALKKKIPGIISIESGENNSVEKRNKDFTDAFVIKFKNEKDRDFYLTHPEHVAFKNKNLPLIDDVFVMDFWSK
ncbi:MAG: Dabb family protein [Candidatus Melainabacteria bacterium]|nr:Dabb family protein [Candidatus Melainabacteria bacterium]